MAPATDTRVNAYQIITDRITALLEEGTIPWQRPWNAESGMPRNLFSQRPYNGINTWLLGSMGYASPFWATFQQARTAGGTVRKGEKGTPIVFWKRFEKEASDGTFEKRFVLKNYWVFNAAQLDGVAIPTLPELSQEFSPIEICEQLVAHMPQRPFIEEGGSQAYYRPSADKVVMPPRATFNDPSNFYSTLFHELTHSTGHESRLKRDLSAMVRFGDRGYAKEELVAEMGAAYLCGVCGIENSTVDQSAAYIKNWLSVLRGDVKMLVSAAGQAQKAADFIQGFHLQIKENVPQDN